MMRIQLIALLSNRKFIPVSLPWGCTPVLEYSMSLYICICVCAYMGMFLTGDLCLQTPAVSMTAKRRKHWC